MKLVAIHRHPVKAMAGEVLDFAEIDQRGLVGDRGWAVVTEDGKFASAKNSRRFRRHDEVYDYAATISSPSVETPSVELVETPLVELVETPSAELPPSVELPPLVEFPPLVELVETPSAELPPLVEFPPLVELVETPSAELPPLVELVETPSTSGVYVTGPHGRWRAGDPALNEELSHRLGAPVRLEPERDVSFFDSSPVSIVGTATLARFREQGGIDADHRRLRANLLIETDEPFVEDSWIGCDLKVGAVRLHVTKQVTRCRAIDMAQNGLGTTTDWLKALGPREARLAVYAEVVTPGVIRTGDDVKPLTPERSPDPVGEPGHDPER